MDFYDRKTELESLNRSRINSKKSPGFTVMAGRRRIGKTALLMEAVKNQKYLYLFVSRQDEALLCAQFQQRAEEALGLQIFGAVSRFRDLFEQLLLFSIKESYTLIIDEFQEFERINPSIFGEIQNLWDQYQNRARINFIACGSIYSMMMKIFENAKEPLFGRLTARIILKPFTVSVIKEILSDYNPRHTPEDLLCLYMISGGVPKYISLLMDGGALNKNKMLNMVTAADSPFLNEGKDLLISEFGKDYGTYFSILQLIAAGKNTQSEIDSIIGKNTGTYLINLERDYSLIIRSKPVFSKPESRNAHWKIGDNYLRFWFRFIYPNQGLVETGRLDLLRELIDRDYETYSGLVLENYFREKLGEEKRITGVGNFWDNKGENEIDIVALNDLDKTAIVAEVKRNPKKINISTLTMKAAKIQKELGKYRVEFRGFSMEDM
ncbi:ATPase [Spirochaetia bacterium]|nr:ATPase [Spirochaetia bacterium]